MIFTIGIKETYDKYLNEQNPARKAKGGSVWKTLKEARRYVKWANVIAKRSYDVYEVQADWETDTKKTGELTNPPYRSLTRDADLSVIRPDVEK